MNIFLHLYLPTRKMNTAIKIKTTDEINSFLPLKKKKKKKKKKIKFCFPNLIIRDLKEKEMRLQYWFYFYCLSKTENLISMQPVQRDKSVLWQVQITIIKYRKLTFQYKTFIQTWTHTHTHTQFSKLIQTLITLTNIHTHTYIHTYLCNKIHVISHTDSCTHKYSLINRQAHKHSNRQIH